MHEIKLCLTLATASSLVAAAGHAQSDSAALARLGIRADSALLAAVPRGFSGAVRIEKNGAVVLFKGYGLANREQSLPFTTETVVPLGITTRNLTLAALLRLQAKGALRMTDSLAKYFPTAPADKRRVTLQQLVDHDAGVPTRIGADDEAIGRDDFTRRALETPLKFAPGAAVNYSNVGYGLIAAILEQVTSKSYDEQVRDDLLATLGLANTGFLLPNFDTARVAHGYINGIDQGTALVRPHAPDGLWWNARGSNGTLSTLGDVHAFYSALFTSDKLLTTLAKKRWFDPGAPVKYVSLERATSLLYERMPRQQVEVIIASNSKEVDALQVRIRLGEVVELLLEGADKVAEAGVQSKAKRSSAKAHTRSRKHHFHIGHHHH